MQRYLAIFGVLALFGGIVAATHGQRLNRSGRGEVADADGDTGIDCTSDDVCSWKTNLASDFTFTANDFQVNTGSSLTCVDAAPVLFGTGDDASIAYRTAVTPDALVVGVSTDSRNLIVCEQADIATDWALAQQTNPTLVIQSATAGTPAQRVMVAHNQTDGVVTTGTGDLVVSPAGGDLFVGAGTAGTDFGLKFNGEDSDASIVHMEDEGRLDVSETVNVTGYVRASTGFLGMVGAQYFCGQGANGATATYIGPVITSLADDMRTYIFGGAGCDGLDNTTEGTADNALDFGGDFKVAGMRCWHAAGGTDDVYTFQLRDDAADVTGVTCTTTLDGTAKGCSVVLTTPVTVAGTSAVAVKQVAATDDNMSGVDTECVVFYTF